MIGNQSAVAQDPPRPPAVWPMRVEVTCNPLLTVIYRSVSVPIVTSVTAARLVHPFNSVFPFSITCPDGNSKVKLDSPREGTCQVIPTLCRSDRRNEQEVGVLLLRRIRTEVDQVPRYPDAVLKRRYCQVKIKAPRVVYDEREGIPDLWMVCQCAYL